MKLNLDIWENEEQRDYYLTKMKEENPYRRKEFSFFNEITMSQWHSLFALTTPIRVKKKKNSLNSISYMNYLITDHWEIQKRKIHKRHKTCVACNSDKNLHVHHRTYKNKGDVGKESNDLFLLCKECHNLIHKHRPIDGKIRG